MPEGDEIGQAMCEAASFTVLSEIELLAKGSSEIGAATPVLVPLCVALLHAKGIVYGANRNRDDLDELYAWCDVIMVQVIDRAKTSSASMIDLKPLAKCIEELAEVAQRYHSQRTISRLLWFRTDGDDIRELRERILAVVPVVGLSGVVDLLARQRPQPKLPPVPENAPATKSWHVVRDGVEDRVCHVFARNEGPAVAALTGRSGSGKTTAAAAMVGERSPILPHAGETEDAARARLNRVRALFPDGVVWLRVGRGGADRLFSLMGKLSRWVHEDVMKGRVEAPGWFVDGESYVKTILSRESMRCLVVADDVWEAKVVDKLRETGMWVLLTTPNPSIVKRRERVVSDSLTQQEAEEVLRVAAGLPRAQGLCDSAREVLEVCGRVAMDIAFVGSWGSVRTTDDVPKGSEAWAAAVRDILAKIDEVRAMLRSENAGKMSDVDVNRLAVLRAGFSNLGVADPIAQELYAALTVFPDGHSFGTSDAAVLLEDEDAAARAITIFERGGVLCADSPDTYRMHDAHVNFARDKLMGWEDVRKLAVDRWTVHLSLLEVAFKFDLDVVVEMWRLLKRMGGEWWWASRPYDDQLVQMDEPDLHKGLTIYFVGRLFDSQEGSSAEREELMQRVLARCDDRGEDDTFVRSMALRFIG